MRLSRAIPILLTLLAACHSNPSGPPGLLTIDPQLMGNLEWVRKTGGLGPGITEPAEGERVVIAMTWDYMYREYRNDTLKYADRFIVSKPEWASGSFALEFASGGRHPLVFVGASSDSLRLWDGCSDGHFYDYRRIDN